MLKLNIKTPRDFINPLLSKKSIKNTDFDNFKKNLDIYKTEIEAQHAAKQSEPNIVTNALKPFVESMGYKTTVHSQKGQSGIDLIILKDGRPSVIIEAKKYQSTEMITKDRLDKRAFYETVLYFMRERNAGNMTIFSIVITDFFNWFVFDAKDFDRLFWKDKIVKKLFDNYNNPKELGDTTKDFYEPLGEVLRGENFEGEIDCAYFNLKEPQDDKNLIAIYKLISADSLLKEFNPNDANTLNEDFYSELLYILGLEEVKAGSKKIIQRAKYPQAGSLYENIATKLSQYHIDQDFELIIKIMIVWVNRILFLKLLESQIVRWNNNKEYRFLNTDKIDDFDKLEMLFFEILAKKQEDRKHREFDYIPYLNSSLFELNEVEEKYLKISNLADDLTIAYYPKTVIKDDRLNRKTGSVKTLHYLFEFLDAYDFSADSEDELVKDNKSLINASVLGLIFEKLNGYRDGSFYTPSFITSYMAKETITKAVIDKFNRVKSWEAKTIIDIYNKIDDIKEANDIIDTLTICDPAVGSGHFLVSALNVLLALKSELGILVDEDGKKIKDYTISVENDELIIKDEYGNIFDYKRDSREKTRIQKTLFKEKQKIIENQLFGVDINPISVNICRLRLWIELLKNAYYKEDGTLETLPNIDINIKCGNSLISRFGLTDELKIKNIKHEIEHYKRVVTDYKENLGSKKEILKSIENLKEKFKLTLKAEWKVAQARNAKLKEYVGEYGYDGLDDDLVLIAIKNNYKQAGTLFGDLDEEKRLMLKKELSDLQAQCDEMESGKIYDNAFEWRFEFPEVLDDNGEFVGFDIVIGNPPYIDSETMVNDGLKDIRNFISNRYSLTKGNWDIYIAFFERSFEITNKNGKIMFITPDKWITKPFGKELRNNYLQFIAKIVKAGRDVFDNALVDSLITLIDKNKRCKLEAYEMNSKVPVFKNAIDTSKNTKISFDMLFSKNLTLLDKINKIGYRIKDLAICENACSTSDAYKLKDFILDISPESFKENTYLKVINTGTIDKYISKHGVSKMTYLKDKYTFPVVNKNDFLENFKNSYGNKSTKTKVIIKGLTLLDACLDLEGIFVPGKSTLVITSENLNLLKILAAVINSKLAFFYVANMYSSSSYNGGINFKKDMINNIPLPKQKILDFETLFVEKVDKILKLKKSGSDTSELEREIDDMVYKLYNLTQEEIDIIEGVK